MFSKTVSHSGWLKEKASERSKNGKGNKVRPSFIHNKQEFSIFMAHMKAVLSTENTFPATFFPEFFSSLLLPTYFL